MGWEGVCREFGGEGPKYFFSGSTFPPSEASRPIFVNLLSVTIASRGCGEALFTLASQGLGGLETSFCLAMTVFERLKGDSLNAVAACEKIKTHKMGLDALALPFISKFLNQNGYRPTFFFFEFIS